MKLKFNSKAKSYLWFWVSTVLFWGAIQCAQAEDREVDPARQRANACLACHGKVEYSRERFGYAAPKLGGQNAQYIVDALDAYKNSSRPDKGIHRDNAFKMSAPEITDVADFFAKVDVDDTSPVAANRTNAAAGLAYDKNKAAYDRKKVACASCHSKMGDQPTQSDWPKLAGQHRDYIVHALRAYKSGQRKHPVMTLQAEILDLTDEDIQKMAYHYSVRKSLTDTIKVTTKVTTQ